MQGRQPAAAQREAVQQDEELDDNRWVGHEIVLGVWVKG